MELDKDLCRQSLARIQKLGLEKRATILNGDLLKQNYSSADLVTVYLLHESIDSKVQPLLDKQLKKGARVVAHDFEFKSWTPEASGGRGAALGVSRRRDRRIPWTSRSRTTLTPE